MKQALLPRIQEKIPSLPESERKIGELILAKPLDVIQMSAAELAKVAGSSAAAVIRFCRSIGVNGFTELKLQLSAVSNAIQEDVYTDILPEEDLASIKKKVLFRATATLEQTDYSLDNDSLEKAVNLIVKSPTVYVYGIGASYLAALDIKQKFTRVGKHVICSQDQHELAASMAIAPKGCVYIGVSNSGDKKEVLVGMEVASKWGLHTISLTADRPNPLSELADIALKTADTKEAPLRSGATFSLLNQLYAVDVLFLYFMTKQYKENIYHLERSKKAAADLSDFVTVYSSADYEKE